MWPFARRPKVPYRDETLRCPYRRSVMRAMQKRDWKYARALLDVSDPDELAFLLQGVGRVDGVQDWIGEWVEAHRDSTLPLLVAGTHAVSWAWEARGDKRAQYTTREQFRVFHERLHYAEAVLQQVVERDPDNVSAWSWLVTSAMGLGIGADETRRRFDQVVRLHPGHVVGHEAYLQYLCEKWRGSHEEMFDFARTTAAKAPPASLLHGLIATAHIEFWHANPDRAAADAYVESPEVRAEIRAAAEASVFHPDHMPVLSGWAPRVAGFAMALQLAEDLEGSWRAFLMLNNLVTDWPWQYEGDPVERFTAFRDYAESNR